MIHASKARDDSARDGNIRDDSVRDESLRDDSGFTLMEMLVVLVIIALIAAVAIPQVMRLLESAKTKAARIQLQTVSQAINFYQLDNDALPTTAEGLSVLLNAPADSDTWAGPYVRGPEQLRDPWGKALLYRSPAGDKTFALTTLGADGREGGTGEDKDVTFAE